MAEFKMAGVKKADFDMDKTNINSDDSTRSSSTGVSLMSDKEKGESESPESPERTEGRVQRTWYEFSQSTTMHGVNKITEQTPFTMRR